MAPGLGRVFIGKLHIAGVTRNAVIRMLTIAATNILEYLRGEPIDRANLVNPTVLERPSHLSSPAPPPSRPARKGRQVARDHKECERE